MFKEKLPVTSSRGVRRPAGSNPSVASKVVASSLHLQLRGPQRFVQAAMTPLPSGLYDRWMFKRGYFVAFDESLRKFDRFGTYVIRYSAGFFFLLLWV